MLLRSLSVYYSSAICYSPGVYKPTSYEGDVRSIPDNFL